MVILKLSSSVIGDSNNKTNFMHKVSLTDWEVSRLYKAFAINSSTYFDSFRVEYILKEIKIFKVNKNITINNYRIRANDSMMYWYFCIGFIDFILKGKSLLDYTNYMKTYMKRMIK